ncbi:AAA family ATPase [Mucilaginibacter gossypii]|uniref:RecF/RecN/SMC N terminal domain-containing protein n=1 Tax=Mucilaginibacter gossypii TaxID=551996 RepID=A0A1G8J5G8_9SPHI|nr:AAA family ATPase [Mucilaginibacter gossypii]SDI26515.1 RecF/RecN/SMC N terminal domain-containing protein [Mucilaginibacter gossypii]
MQKIRKLILQNFKFFLGNHELDFERKNVLLYGENGSGKSSIYWALYTFLQSVFKTDNLEIRKYFDPKHNENLINRYSDEHLESSIAIIFEDEHKATSRREISLSTINTKSDNLVLETTLGSDFLDHNVLSRIYAYYHKEETDLFDFFQHQLFSFINFREELIKPGESKGNKNAEYWWDYIAEGLSPQPKMHEQRYKDFQLTINTFNIEFEYYLVQIQQTTNEYLEEKFEEKFKVKFNYKKATYNDFKVGSKGRTWKLKYPKIIMSVELITTLIPDANKKIVNSPQSFLNEAKLSTMALAIRLAILDEKFVKAYPKILVLDDLLMSMDMSNREFVLNVIMEGYLEDYQILFFTHQRGLFEDARKFIETYYAQLAKKSGETDTLIIKNSWKEKWKFFEMYESENNAGIPVPLITAYESSLQKALKYFKSEIDYNACGNNLRISIEEFFREFIPHKFLVNNDGTPIPNTGLMIDTLLVKAREYFDSVGFNTRPLDKLERYRVRSLNPSSHYNPRTEYFKKELQDIFRIIDELKKNRAHPLVVNNQLVKYKIDTQSGKSYIYKARLLDKILLYQKSDGSPSYFIDTDERGYAMLECSVDNVPTALNHEINKCSLQKLYDDTVKHINKTDVALIENDMYSLFTDEIGTSLNNLKLY